MAPQRRGTLTSGTSSEGRVSGYVFKLIREHVGRTQEELAADLGVGPATIQGWESGRRPIMSMPTGSFLAMRTRIRRLGAHPSLLDALDSAMEADHFLAQALSTPHSRAEPDGHLLGSWVITRPFTEMVTWPISGKKPDALGGVGDVPRRRGPVPGGPAFGADERRHIIEHLQTVAERAGRRDASGLLLRRQAYYLIGFDEREDTARWLADMYRAGRRTLPPHGGWSPAWPLTRSTVSAMTRAGDGYDAMRQFITTGLCDEAGEAANLNYWAFWTGDLSGDQTSDAFIAATPLNA
jgi:DNA-binding transcriptional regulator YiaG